MTELIGWLVALWVIVALAGLIWRQIDTGRRRREALERYLNGLPERKK